MCNSINHLLLYYNHYYSLKIKLMKVSKSHSTYIPHRQIHSIHAEPD